MLSDNDLELLSTYIDGALSENERTVLESRLRAEPELRRELARLQATVDLVRLLPPLAAPRDFRLTPRMARRPAVWTSASFSMVSAAAAVILLVVGVALFRLPESVPLSADLSNQVVALPTGEQTQVTKMADEEADTADANAARPGVDGEVAQQPQELRDLGFAATTGTPQSTAAPQLFAAVLPTPTPAVAGLLSDAVSESAADQARQELQPAAPSIASGAAAAEAPLPAPTQLPPPTETAAPTASPTPVPSLTPMPVPTSTSTATPMPTAAPTPTPPAPVLSEPGTLGVGLIVAALILLGVAVVTTLARRRG